MLSQVGRGREEGKGEKDKGRRGTERSRVRREEKENGISKKRGEYKRRERSHEGDLRRGFSGGCNELLLLS